MLDEQKGSFMLSPMNRLPLQKRVRITGLLVEGNGVRSTSRLADVSINTVTKLLVDLGAACAEYHDENVRNVKAQRVQCEEIWSFVTAKAKNITPQKQGQGWGDIWTWTALDADSKLCIGYRVGGRDGAIAYEFMQDLAFRLANRAQPTTDAHRVYVNAVEDALGSAIDYATLVKIYGSDASDDSGHTAPEVQRFTHLTNAFSKKVGNHTAMVAVHFMHYNFARIHKTLRITPAMAAGISDHVWSLEEIALLAE